MYLRTEIMINSIHHKFTGPAGPVVLSHKSGRKKFFCVHFSQTKFTFQGLMICDPIIFIMAREISSRTFDWYQFHVKRFRVSKTYETKYFLEIPFLRSAA